MSLHHEWINQDINSFLVEADEQTLSAYEQEMKYLSSHESLDWGWKHEGDYSPCDFQSLLWMYQSYCEWIEQKPEALDYYIKREAIHLEIKARIKSKPWLALKLPIKLFF